LEEGGGSVAKEEIFLVDPTFYSSMNIFFTRAITIIRREREREDEYAACSFISLSLILMMMMFRTVLLFLLFGSFFLFLHNTIEEEKRQALF
jgi:hypothetical protein